MSFQLTSTTENRPWETFLSLEANLFGLCDLESSWEDLSAVKAEKDPTLPRITMHSRGSLKKDFLIRIGIRYNIFKSAIETKALLVLRD